MTTLLALSVIGIAVGILAAARIVDLLDGHKGEPEKNVRADGATVDRIEA